MTLSSSDILVRQASQTTQYACFCSIRSSSSILLPPTFSPTMNPVYLDASPDLDPASATPKEKRKGQGGSGIMLAVPSDGSSAAQSSVNVVDDVGAAERARRELRMEETIDTSGKRRGRFARYMMAELDKNTTRIPLAINCFLSGCKYDSRLYASVSLTHFSHPSFRAVIGSVTFSATSVW